MIYEFNKETNNDCDLKCDGNGFKLMIQFPIVPAVSFLSYDPKDIIIVIAGFIYGPMTSFIMSLLCSVFRNRIPWRKLIDVLMNVISTCTFCMCCSLHL